MIRLQHICLAAAIASWAGSLYGADVREEVETTAGYRVRVIGDAHELSQTVLTPQDIWLFDAYRLYILDTAEYWFQHVLEELSSDEKCKALVVMSSRAAFRCKYERTTTTRVEIRLDEDEIGRHFAMETERESEIDDKDRYMEAMGALATLTTKVVQRIATENLSPSTTPNIPLEGDSKAAPQLGR